MPNSNTPRNDDPNAGPDPDAPVTQEQLHRFSEEISLYLNHLERSRASQYEKLTLMVFRTTFMVFGLFVVGVLTTVLLTDNTLAWGKEALQDVLLTTSSIAGVLLLFSAILNEAINGFQTLRPSYWRPPETPESFSDLDDHSDD